MSNKTTFTVEGIAKLDISQVKGAVDQMKKGFQGITLPAGINKRVAQIFSQMTDEIAEFEVKSKSATTNADWSRVLSSGQKIMTLYQKLQGQVRQLGDLSEKEMSQLFPSDIAKNIKAATDAIKAYESANKKAINTAKKALSSAETEAGQKRITANAEKGKKVVNQSTYDQAVKKKEDTYRALEARMRTIDKLQKSIAEAESKYYAQKPDGRFHSTKEYQDLKKQVEMASTGLTTLQQNAQKADQALEGITTQGNLDAVEREAQEAEAKVATLVQQIAELNTKGDPQALQTLFDALSKIDGIDLTNVPRDLEGAKQALQGLTTEQLDKIRQSIGQVQNSTEGAKSAFQGLGQYIDKTTDALNDMTSMQSQVDQLKNSFMHFFSLTSGWMLLKRGIRQAYETVKELDDAMTEIAVVSDYTLDEIWEMRDDYTKAASDMGVATIDMVNAQKLYIQQGLDLAEATEVATETIKMARIANLDGAEATNLMTAALRGFNMEMEEANRVNDVYSELAAKTAADTEEIATAMSKTASIASNAGASFENTSAFLAQIIETTREAPETAGTALKTIIARFQELKKAPSEIGEVDGEMVDANKIETALASAGVALRNTQGEFRNFDDVIIELSGKWNSLNVMTQRYIATMAAGSRQQSRFIALMSDSERLMELTGYAANSAGASNAQFEKTLDSLDAKINRLKNSWGLFLQNLANNQVIKAAVDALNSILTLVNNLTSAFPGLLGSVVQLLMLFGAFRGAQTIINNLFSSFGAAFFKSGQQAGAAYTSGIQAGTIKGMAGIKLLMAKIRAMFLKTKFTINPKVNIKPITMLMASTKKLTVAEKAYNAIQKSTTASTATKTAAEAKYAAVKAHVVQEETTALAVAGLNNAQIATYNSLRSIGVAADIALLAVQGGLNKKMQEQIITQGVANGLTATEIKQRLADAAATMAQLKADGLLGSEETMSLGRKAALAVAFLFANKEKKKQIAATLGLTAATAAETAADTGQAAAQWTVNIATYAFPGTWLLLIILAIIAAVALLVVGLVALADALTESDAEKMERLNKNAEEAAEAADRAAEAYNNLKTGLSDFQDGINNIADLTRGTQEFRDAIIESNMQALELLETYDLLAAGVSVNSDGLITFTDEAMENAMQNATMQKVMTATNSLFANAAVKEEEQNQRSKTQRTSGDFTFTVVQEKGSDGSATGEKKYVSSSLTGASAIQQSSGSTTAVTTHTRQGNATGYSQDGKSYGVTYTASLSEEQITDIAEKFNSLEEGTDSYQDALDELSQTYKLEDEALKGLVVDAMRFDSQLRIDREALEALNTAAIAAAISLNGLVAPENKDIVAETLGAGLTEDVYDWGVSGGANDATYMGDTAINSSGDGVSEGMENFQADFTTVMGRQGQAVNWTNANSEGQTLIDMTRMIDPDKEIKYAADNKEVDDEGEGLGNEFKNTARTVFTQMNAIVLDDAMQQNKELTAMLSGDFGEDTLDAKTLRALLNNTSSNRDDAFTNSVMSGIYKKEQEQLAQQNEVYTRMGKYFAKPDGKAVYSDLSLSDEAQEVKTTLTAMEEAFASGAEDLDTKIDEYGAAVAAYNVLQAEQAKNLVGEEGVFKDVEQMNVFANIVGQMSNDLGQATAAAFSSLGSEDDKNSFINYLANVGDSAIATATAIREMADSNNSALQDAALIMGTFGDKAISVKDQVTELYDIIGSEALAEMAADGGLSASKMMELTKTSSETQQVLDNTGISAHTLAEYYTLLSEGTISAISTSETFIKVLDELNAATSTIEDSFGFIDTFEASRSQTEIGSYFGEMRASMQELLDMGAYGDQQLFDYASVIVGEEKLQEMVNTYGDLEIAIKKAMESADFGENFYSMWTKLDAAGSDMISVGENGAIDFDLANIDSIDAFRQEIMTKLNVSDIVADAMIADAQTFSRDLKKGLDKLSLGEALAEWLSSVKTVGGKKVLSEKELNAIAKKAGLDPKEIKEKLQENLDEEDVELVIDPIIKDGKLTDETSSAVFEAFEASGWDVNATYQMLIDLGLDPKDAEKQMQGFIDQAAKGTSNFPFQFNGEVFKGTVGQLKTSVSTAIADGTIDPVVQAAQKLTAAQQAAQLSSGVAQGVAAGLGGAIQAFVELVPEPLRKHFGIDKKAAANFTASMIDKAKTAAATSGDTDVRVATEAYENALNTTKKLQEEKEKEDAKNKAAAEKTEKDLLGDDNNASGYTNRNSQLRPGEGFGDKKDKEDKEDDDTWEEDYDWLYNLEKKIAKQVRERNKLESEYNRMLTLGNATQGELLEKIREQVAAENSHMDLLNKEKSKREQELKALKNEFSDVSAYVKWDAATGAPKIDHKAMKGVSDPKLGERIDKAVEEFERIQGELEQIEDDTNDIKDAQADRLREQLDQYVSLEERLYDAIVSEREKEIEELETINETISDAASEMLDKIQTGIDDYRQAREDEEALSDIEDMESRLALMRSDTSGANQLDILALEDELEQARQDFTDNKIDQAIDQLSRQNELAQQQRERQIELMQWQLEQDQENGMIADQVNKLLTYFSASGDSTTIEDMLKNSENWTGLATQQKNDWVNELNDTIAKAGEGWRNANAASNTVASGSSITFTDKNGKTVKGTMQSDGSVKDKSGNTYSGVFLGADGKYHQYADGKITAKPKAKPTTSTTTTTTSSSKGIKITDSVKKYVSDSIWGGYWGNNPERKKRLTEVFGAKAAAEIQGLVNQGVRFYPKGSRREWSYENQKKKKYNRYETGGLADFTGPAWLDGTKARPEYVLNAEQTKGFLALVDMLGDFDDNPTAGGNNYYDVRIEVDELSNDYDVEQLMDKMKRVITDDAMYRNVNAIDLGRR